MQNTRQFGMANNGISAMQCLCFACVVVLHAVCLVYLNIYFESNILQQNGMETPISPSVYYVSYSQKRRRNRRKKNTADHPNELSRAVARAHAYICVQSFSHEAKR